MFGWTNGTAADALLFPGRADALQKIRDHHPDVIGSITNGPRHGYYAVHPAYFDLPKAARVSKPQTVPASMSTPRPGVRSTWITSSSPGE